MERKKVVLSTTAKSKLTNLLEYLKSEWSEKVQKEFITKMDKSMSRISHYPKSCPESIEIKGLFKCVVTKQTSLFYRINPQEIEAVTLFDTRQNPAKLKKMK
ncbi:MAG: type II toxin-antitoxin system RelE/ParE family toxin [Reichenbachiella sp.]|uniref:type II toxin-antitoxin system RelE/ParE family toxin n=1 Tax=Reichenbachiella sp. TaxID=2184521 RepID=UPI003264BB04